MGDSISGVRGLSTNRGTTLVNLFPRQKRGGRPTSESDKPQRAPGMVCGLTGTRVDDWLDGQCMILRLALTFIVAIQ